MSRVHAELRHSHLESLWVITCLSASSNIIIERQRDTLKLLEQKSLKLVRGDVIKLGELGVTKLRFY